MSNIKKCTSCGSETIVEGELSGAVIAPIGKPFTNGSNIITYICKDCGEVLSIKVKNTSIFK